MFKAIKQMLRNPIPLSYEEVNSYKELSLSIKREIGKLGRTFDEDVFELLALLELQVGKNNLRNLNTSLRILVSLHNGTKKVKVDKNHSIDTSNIYIPKKFIPLTSTDVVHAYCGVLSLTASGTELEGLDVPLNYLKTKLSEHIKQSDFAFAFVDGLIQFINAKDETLIPVLKENWYSLEPTTICREFINDAFEQSRVLKGNKPNQLYFLYYCLYNLL